MPAPNNPKQAAPTDEPNLERPHRRRLGEREMTEPNKLDPTPGLPDNTLISDVEFPARIRKVLTAAGLKTVGEFEQAKQPDHHGL
jgi:hypothetical protein